MKTDDLIAKLELKPCPFCGAGAEKIFIGNNYTKKRSVVIKCTECFTEQRTGAIHNTHEWCDNKATEKWNKRTLKAELNQGPEKVPIIKEKLLAEVIDKYQQFTKWVVRHVPEIQGSDRSLNMLNDIDLAEHKIREYENATPVKDQEPEGVTAGLRELLSEIHIVIQEEKPIYSDFMRYLWNRLSDEITKIEEHEIK